MKYLKKRRGLGSIPLSVVTVLAEPVVAMVGNMSMWERYWLGTVKMRPENSKVIYHVFHKSRWIVDATKRNRAVRNSGLSTLTMTRTHRNPCGLDDLNRHPLRI